MKHVMMTWITQKCPTLGTRFERFRVKRYLAPARHQTTDSQTPVGVQVVHDPIISLHLRQALIRLLEMSNKVGCLTGSTDRPGKLPGCHGGCIRVRVARADRAVRVWWALCAPALACRFFHRSRSPNALVGNMPTLARRAGKLRGPWTQTAHHDYSASTHSCGA